MSEERRWTVLLVDDEPRILSALQRALRREGYQLLTADTPQEALRRVASEPVDCILSDHKMPGMTGMQLMAAIAERHPAIVRLMLTGWNQEIDPAGLEQLGIRAVLPKPWNDAELKSTLRKALQEDPAASG